MSLLRKMDSGVGLLRDGDAGAGYVFRKRLPRLYNQDCLENLDEEELHVKRFPLSRRASG